MRQVVFESCLLCDVHNWQLNCTPASHVILVLTDTQPLTYYEYTVVYVIICVHKEIWLHSLLHLFLQPKLPPLS